MRKLILFVVSFLGAATAIRAQQADTQAVNAASVPIEEYVPKVIIEGKWGSAPGEFGMASRFPLGEFEQYTPSSLAVNSNGEVYVLDYVNNRIQKFTASGKYLLAIPVEGLKGTVAGYCLGNTCYEVPPDPGLKYDRPVMGELSTMGVNVVMDSKDTLHYYLKRITDGKETGEVWEFRKDTLVKKTAQKNTSAQQSSAGTYVDPKIDADVKEITGRKKYSAMDKKKRVLDFQLDVDEELYGERRVLYNETVKKWAVRVKKVGKVWDKIYDPSGKLIVITEVSPLSEITDSRGSRYFIEISPVGLMIRKNELTRKLK